MIIFRALKIEDYSSISSNVTKSHFPNYSEGTQYQLGDQVNSGDFEYEALAPSLGVAPVEGSNSDSWLLLGYVNRLRVLDQRIYSSPTQREGFPINYQLTPLAPMDSIALFGVLGDEVLVQVRTIVGDTLVWSSQEQLYDANQTDWYDHLFAFPMESTQPDDLFRDSFYVSGVPFVLGQHLIRIVVYPRESSGFASVGQICLGFGLDLGETLVGVRSEMVDYSRKEFNEFGEVSIVKRGYAFKTDYPLAVPLYRTNAVKRIVAAYRGDFCVFSPSREPGNDFRQLVSYGVPSSYSTEFVSGNTAYSTLTVDGVI